MQAQPQHATPPHPPPSHLHTALLESRERWRAFSAMATDFAFEADGEGRLQFVAPEGVLGWPGSSLLGRPATVLLAGRAGPDPFRPGPAARHRRAWLLGADGAARCFDLTVESMTDARGRPGVRGVGTDVTAREQADMAAAAAMRRGTVLDHILTELRTETDAPRMTEAVLGTLMRSLGAAGATLLHEEGAGSTATVGAPLPPPVMADVAASVAEGRVLSCPVSTRFGQHARLLAWRTTASRPWDADDAALAGAVSGIIRIILEHAAIQTELARQARTDHLTGLLNRRAFLEECGRRLDRLDRGGQPGTLLVFDLDRLGCLNDRAGYGVGDQALLRLSALLRRTFRPTDLLARLGGDEFAAWLDTSDHLTAAERAEDLRLRVPGETGPLCPGLPPVTLSAGLACRQPGSGEDLDNLMQRADAALRAVKRAGGAAWRVCLENVP